MQKIEYSDSKSLTIAQTQAIVSGLSKIAATSLLVADLAASFMLVSVR